MIRQRHFLRIHRPRTIGRQNFAVVQIPVGSPVFGIDEIGPSIGLFAIVFHRGITDKLLVEFIPFGMGNNELIIGSVHPLGKRVRNRLRQCAGMRRPREYHFRPGSLLEFLDRDKVGETLQRMPCRRLHADDRFPRITDELFQNDFVIIIDLVVELRKRAHADDIAISAHHGNGFQHVLRLITIHHYTFLRFQLPCTLIDIQHNDIHSEIQRRFLRAQSGAQARIEKYHQ